MAGKTCLSNTPEDFTIMNSEVLKNAIVLQFKQQIPLYKRRLQISKMKLLNELSWINLHVRRKLLIKLSLMYKMVFKIALPYLCHLYPDFLYDRSCYSLCSARNLCLPYVCTDRHKKSFLFSSVKWWNSLPLEIHSYIIFFRYF